MKTAKKTARRTPKTVARPFLFRFDGGDIEAGISSKFVFTMTPQRTDRLIRQLSSKLLDRPTWDRETPVMLSQGGVSVFLTHDEAVGLLDKLDTALAV